MRRCKAHIIKIKQLYSRTNVRNFQLRILAQWGNWYVPATASLTFPATRVPTCQYRLYTHTHRQIDRQTPPRPVNIYALTRFHATTNCKGNHRSVSPFGANKHARYLLPNSPLCIRDTELTSWHVSVSNSLYYSHNVYYNIYKLIR